MTQLTQDNTLQTGVIDQILQIGMEHAPLEACGLLMFRDGDCGVQNIVNKHKNPENGSFMEPTDLWDAMINFYGEHWLLHAPSEIVHNSLVLWHTHPHGRVGPSAVDLEMRQKTPQWRMLVVSIPTGEWVEF